MPSVIFHVRGKRFRPEVELAKTSLKAYRIFHAGDVTKFSRGDIVFKDSGFSVNLGPRNSEDLRKQIKTAFAFIKKHYSEIKRLKEATDLSLAFGYSLQFDKNGGPFWIQGGVFSAEFLRMCGELNISIDLSLYYGATVDRLISHYMRVLKLKHSKQTRRVAKK
jgi:hypothetical protein